MSESNNSNESDAPIQRIDPSHADHVSTSAAGNSDARDVSAKEAAPDDSSASDSPAPAMTRSQADRPRMDGPPRGLRRPASDGTELIDAMAGRASLFGFGFQPHLDAITAATESYLGDAANTNTIETAKASADAAEDELIHSLRSTLGDSIGIEIASAYVVSSPDLAVERAIELARKRVPDARYRTIALAGSDHGRTGVCRTASGRPQLHTGYGPMMAGFAHVPAGDVDALRHCIDDQTAAVLLSPLDRHDAATPLSKDYLVAVRQLCDQHDLLLLVDESPLCVGSAGTPLVFQSIADIAADAVVIAGGLFAGLPGAILMTNDRMTPSPVADTSRFPMLNDVARATLAEIRRQDVLVSVRQTMNDFAVELAECIGHYEFVRDIHATGMTLGVVTDVQSSELVRAAARHGLRMEAAGDTSILLQPPPVLSDDDQQSLMEKMGATMDVVRRDFADLVTS